MTSVRDLELDGCGIVERYRAVPLGDLAKDVSDDPFILEVLFARLAELRGEVERLNAAYDSQEQSFMALQASYVQEFSDLKAALAVAEMERDALRAGEMACFMLAAADAEPEPKAEKLTGLCSNECADIYVNGDSMTCNLYPERTMGTPCRECVYFHGPEPKGGE